LRYGAGVANSCCFSCAYKSSLSIPGILASGCSHAGAAACAGASYRMAWRAQDLENTALPRGEAWMAHHSSLSLVMTVRFLWMALVLVGASSTAAD